MTNKAWFINLNWDHNIEIWMNCRKNGRAAIGWGDPHDEVEHPAGRRAEGYLRQVAPGDRIVAFLKNRRLGGWGTVTEAYNPQDYDPQLRPGTDEPDFGKVVHVQWEQSATPPLGKAALMKREEMYGFNFMYTISPLRPDSFDRLKGMIEDPKRWEPIYELEEVVPESAETATEDSEDDEAPSPLRETALRQLLAQKLDLIESGLVPFQKGNSAEEFQVGIAGRIDLLCKDRNGNPVVIELKRDRSSDEVIGQLARYMGYVKKHLLPAGKIVRGIVVAHAIDERLELAVDALANAELRVYQVQVSVHKPKANGGPCR